MTPAFSVRTTPHYERLARRLNRHQDFGARQVQAIGILIADPRALPIPLRHQWKGSRASLLWPPSRGHLRLASAASLLDHDVGAGEDGERERDAEVTRSLQVHGEKRMAYFHREVAGPGAA